MLTWDYWVFQTVSISIGNLIYFYRLRQGDFDGMSKTRKFWAQGVSMSAPMILFAIPYTMWMTSGFLPRDARAAERQIVHQLLSQGAQSAEAHFIVLGHSKMSGAVTARFPDGHIENGPCHAEKGEQGDLLVLCP